MVLDQVLLDEGAIHFQEIHPWVHWCYGKHPILWHALGCLTSELSVQQGDLSGTLLFALVLHKVVIAIALRSQCSSLLLNSWYMDDGVLAGPSLVVNNALTSYHP